MRVMTMVLALLLAAPALAQDDPMEAQRCIWRCLADAQGADDPAYGICVEQRCSGPDPAISEPYYDMDGSHPAPSPWTDGVTAANDGGRYAGVADPARGTDFYFVCALTGQSFLMFSGVEGPSAQLTLRLGGQAFALWFEEQGVAYVAAVPVDAPVMAALWSAPQMQVLNGSGTVLGDFPLQGAPQAITNAWNGCTARG